LRLYQVPKKPIRGEIIANRTKRGAMVIKSFINMLVMNVSISIGRNINDKRAIAFLSMFYQYSLEFSVINAGNDAYLKVIVITIIIIRVAKFRKIEEGA